MSPSRAIVLRNHGAAGALRVETVEVGDPGPGEVRLRQTAIGVDFHDVHVRSGPYQTLALPGIEGVGEALGGGVSGLAVGERIGHISPQHGA